ncbi:uncharacterized protein LOC124365479 [Homalodisca vitripennis]|uniref:uncharacterized protein LOC124365479 n=1 Tax=Homalodisca vitripennis TaxID=197043 RepID=UPI001EECDE34|nr:uncharacterized protein LOC124365479 [Homalodisca vitripennis]
MNTFLKGNDLEINAYLDSLSLHQSFEEDDTEDDEILNPSGSVLQPASNPYNKQRKIAEANESLFAEGVIAKSPKMPASNPYNKQRKIAEANESLFAEGVIAKSPKMVKFNLPASNPYNKQRKIAEANESLFAEGVIAKSPKMVKFNLPASNPYNKQRKIAEANESLFAEGVIAKSPKMVKFNLVNRGVYSYSEPLRIGVTACQQPLQQAEKDSRGQRVTPASNPYNKQRKIAEANESLFAEGVIAKSPKMVKFNLVNRDVYSYSEPLRIGVTACQQPLQQAEKDSRGQRPASNPYNKQRKIAEANESLFAEEVIAKSPKMVKFNLVNRGVYSYSEPLRIGVTACQQPLQQAEKDSRGQRVTVCRGKTFTVTVNPSGSVLQPASNPYNKQRKIAEANESLFAEEVIAKSPKRVKFNKVEKRICYDYFGSSFESDSIKSYDDDESEKESLLQTSNKQKSELVLELKGNNLQPQNHANKVIVTLTPKREESKPTKIIEVEDHESESEDVCVGTIKKIDEPVKESDGTETLDSKQCEETNEDTGETETVESEEDKEPVLATTDSNNEIEVNTFSENKTNCLEESSILKCNDKESKNDDNCEESVVYPETLDHKYNSYKNTNNFYPCLKNHSGITIRITGADSIESVESESSNNELEIVENCDDYQNMLEYQQESTFALSKYMRNNNIRTQEIAIKKKQTFILKGTKSPQNVRSPRPSKKFDIGPPLKPHTKNVGTEKVLHVSKQNLQTNKTEKSLSKEDKNISKPKPVSNMSPKSKSIEDKLNSKTDDGFPFPKKVRPKSCVEKESAKVKPTTRPVTAPVKRSCCQWGQPHLPEYNGLRSEYGLSAEQLMERKRHKVESLKIQKQKREQKFKEEQQKRKENEATFIEWLEKKRHQAQMQFLRNKKLQAESGIKIYPAPTSHLKRTGAVRSRKMFKSQRKCVSLEELLNNAKTHEKKTYKIYLGLSFE